MIYNLPMSQIEISAKVCWAVANQKGLLTPFRPGALANLTLDKRTEQSLNLPVAPVTFPRETIILEWFLNVTDGYLVPDVTVPQSKENPNLYLIAKSSKYFGSPTWYSFRIVEELYREFAKVQAKDGSFSLKT